METTVVEPDFGEGVVVAVVFFVLRLRGRLVEVGWTSPFGGLSWAMARERMKPLRCRRVLDRAPGRGRHDMGLDG